MIKWASVKEIDRLLYFDLSRSVEDRISKPPLEAAIDAVIYIKNNYPSPYTLFLSGGVDSQAMLYAWHISGIPYKTYSAIYNQDLNTFDLTNLQKFSKNYNIEINFYHFNLLNFLESEHHVYAEKYLCGSPHITAYMKLASYVEEGTVIFSGNFVEKNQNFLNANQAAMYRYALTENKPLVPWFFLETEELAYSFDDWTDMPKESSFITGYDRKVYKYHFNKFPVIPQEMKYTGFELVKDFIETNPPRHPSAEDQFLRSIIQPSKRLFDILYRNKYELKYNRFYRIKSGSIIC